MRTTISFEPDVAALVRSEMKRRRIGLKAVVNEALRARLTAGVPAPDPARESFRTRAFETGGSLVGSLDCTSEALSAAEGDAHK